MFKICLKKTGLVFVSLLLFSCSSSSKTVVVPQTKHIVQQKAAVIPPGAVRYCWEEPMVEFEQNSPGLDSDGRFYRPAYTAIREVKQGRSRPCRVAKSEVKGETKNEW